MSRSFNAAFISLVLLDLLSSTAIAQVSTTECKWKIGHGAQGTPSKLSVDSDSRGLLVFHKWQPMVFEAKAVEGLSCRIRLDCTITNDFEGITFAFKSTEFDRATGQEILHIGDTAELNYGKDKPKKACKIVGFAAND